MATVSVRARRARMLVAAVGGRSRPLSARRPARGTRVARSARGPASPPAVPAPAPAPALSGPGHVGALATAPRPQHDPRATCCCGRRARSTTAGAAAGARGRVAPGGTAGGSTRRSTTAGAAASVPQAACGWSSSSSPASATASAGSARRLLEGAARGRLPALVAGPQAPRRRLVRVGPKVDYCLRDLVRTAPLAALAAEAVYPGLQPDPGAPPRPLRHVGRVVGRLPLLLSRAVDRRDRPARALRLRPDRGPRPPAARVHAHDDLSETYVSLPSGRVLGRRVGVSRP